MTQTKALTCWLLTCLVMAACSGDTTPEERLASPEKSNPVTSTDQSGTSIARSEVTATGTATDPCSVLTAAELETVTGFALGPGMFNNLRDQGIEGAACNFASRNDGDGNASVTVVAGEMASALFDSERRSHNIEIADIGDRAIANVNDIQASILLQQGAVILGVSVVYLKGTQEDPSEIQDRLEGLATTAADRL